jgi:hypothetical protein
MKDKRDKTWPLLESEIQARAKKKDKKFILTGKWKKFLRTENGYKVYQVDGSWIRKNLCVYYGHGGHGFVHEFIPLNEIWVATHHVNEGISPISQCRCKLKKRGQKLSKNYSASTVIHEIAECEAMKKGKTFFKSHQIALEAEKKAGLVPDSYTDL